MCCGGFYSNVLPKRFGAGGGQLTSDPNLTTFCPDCEQHIPSESFVQHREQEHPPTTRVLAPDAIKSNEKFGYQTEPGP